MGEPFDVTAVIAGTFLDGSRVPLRVDGEPAGKRWAWARGPKTDDVSFPLKLVQPGEHRLTLGDQSVVVTVENGDGK
jgi:hypothetical protein